MDGSYDNEVLRESNKALAAKVKQLQEEKHILLRKLCWQYCGHKSSSCPKCDECTKKLLTKNW